MRKFLQWTAMALALVCLVGTLAGCGGGGKDPLAIYDEDGKQVVAIGMARATVEKELGSGTSSSKDLDNGTVKYDGLEISYKDSEVYRITAKSAKYSDHKGISVGMKMEDVAKKYNEKNYDVSDSSGNGVVVFDQNKNMKDLTVKGAGNDIFASIHYRVNDKNDSILDSIGILGSSF